MQTTIKSLTYSANFELPIVAIDMGYDQRFLTSSLQRHVKCMAVDGHFELIKSIQCIRTVNHNGQGNFGNR